MFNALSTVVKAAAGFQYSVNLKYDLKNEAKFLSYIPLQQSTELIQNLLQGLEVSNNERSRLLVGSYGTGKSHFVAVLLAFLSRNKEFSNQCYEKSLTRFRNISEETAELLEKQLAQGRFLSVIVQDSGKEFSQTLLNGLQLALCEEGLEDCLPNTSFQAALEQAQVWKQDYPVAFKAFIEALTKNGFTFEGWSKQIKDFNDTAYRVFETIFPIVTHGATFHPLLEGNIGDIYLSVSAEIQKRGYRGIYVVFDEFGKFLESQWSTNQGSGLKVVQDFAEACNSSAERMLQFLLITHKPISQYVTQFSSDLINEWRKIEGRFKYHDLVNTTTKSYEIIAQVVEKNEEFWTDYKRKFAVEFAQINSACSHSNLFSDLSEEDFQRYVVQGGFPLHPVTMFVLPRFASKVAQNERTLFTFLSTNDYGALGWFLHKQNLNEFNLLTLDVLFDYFSQQLQAVDGDECTRNIWISTCSAISRIQNDAPEAVILLKGLAVIKILGLPNVLPATQDGLRFAYIGSELDEQIMANAFKVLMNKSILFEGGSTGTLEIIEPGEIDIAIQLPQMIAKRKSQFSAIAFLNEKYPPESVIAKRYNYDFCMTRFFTARFILGKDILRNGQVVLPVLAQGVDGVINYVLPANDMEWDTVNQALSTLQLRRNIVILPNVNFLSEIAGLDGYLQNLDALFAMQKQGQENKTLRKTDSYVLNLWIREQENAISKILRKLFSLSAASVFPISEWGNVKNTGQLSRLVSEQCLECFPLTPIMNNEMINKHRLTRPIVNARQKLVNALLRPQLQSNLGLSGSGPEVAIYRSLLKHTGIVIDNENEVRINAFATLHDPAILRIMNALQYLFDHAEHNEVTFAQIIQLLVDEPYGIRKGIIPILLAIFLHENHKEISLFNGQGKELVWDAEKIEEALKEPEQYRVCRYGWSEQKTVLCDGLQELFNEYSDDNDVLNPANRSVMMMKRWLISLPRYTRETKALSQKTLRVRKCLKQWNMPSAKLLFEELPVIAGGILNDQNDVYNILAMMKDLKAEMEGHIYLSLKELEESLVKCLPVKFKRTNLLASLREWYDALPNAKKEEMHFNITEGTQEVIDKLLGFKGENSELFLKNIAAGLVGVRLEDWHDNIAKTVQEQFALVIEEINELNDEDLAGLHADKFQYSFIDKEGKEIQGNSFKKVTVSSTGQLLQNVLASYLNDFGDAVPKNEKRQIILELLQSIE